MAGSAGAQAGGAACVHARVHSVRKKERTDHSLLILVPERHVRQAHRVPVADNRVLLLRERCATTGGRK
jgi:hypothetical protein